MWAKIDSPLWECQMRSARQVAADGDAHHQGTGEVAVRSPPDGGRLAAQLLHGRPDVVEELDLGARPQPAQGLSDAAADDVRLRQGCVVATGRPEASLQPAGDPEHAALALDVVEHVVIGVGDVLTEHADALVRRPAARGG